MITRVAPNWFIHTHTKLVLVLSDEFISDKSNFKKLILLLMKIVIIMFNIIINFIIIENNNEKKLFYTWMV